MSLIHISDLSFRHEGGVHDIFTSVSLQLNTHWKLGLIGRNGKGKTTLLRLLAGQLEYSGTITGPVNFEYFPFPVENTHLPVRDIMHQICPHLYDEGREWEIDRELDRLQANPDILDRQFCKLSNGERCKVMLAALFLKPEAFLLIDEPTNHLDTAGRQQVSAYLQKKRGFILVSHDRHFLDNSVDHVLAINRANIELQQGNYTSWKQNRDYQDNFELARQDKLKKDIKKLEDAAQRASEWSGETEKTKYKPHNGKIPRHQQAGINRGAVGHKAAKMMKRSKYLEDRRDKAVQDASSLLQNRETVAPLKIHPLRHHASILVEAVDLSLAYTGQSPLFQGLSFSLGQGDRIALQGSNGCGKSSLINRICGTPSPAEVAGNLRIASRLVISRVEQDLSFLCGSLEQFCRYESLDESLFRAILDRLDFSSKLYWKEDLRTLSDGQRKKVVLAKSLAQQAHLYIWDEPLNFMDIIAREQIESLLLEFAPTMIFVEHDQAFVHNVATHIVEISA